MNIPQFIYEIHAVRVICIDGQTHNQQLGYPKSIYSSNKKWHGQENKKFESHNQDMYLTYTDLYY